MCCIGINNYLLSISINFFSLLYVCCVSSNLPLERVVKQHAMAALVVEDIIDGPFFKVVVRRRHVLQDALRAVRLTSDSSQFRPLRVQFVGDSGVDAGGLRREFATLLASDFATSTMLEGPSGRRLFSHDMTLLSRNTCLLLVV